MDKLTAIKIKYDDGTYSDEIPVSVLSENVEWDNTHTLVDVLGSVNVDVTGTIQDQISQLFNEKVSNSDMQSYISSSMPTYITNWLNTNVNPVGSAVVVDSSLTISGAAADSRVVGLKIKNIPSLEIIPITGKHQYINLSQQSVTMINNIPQPSEGSTSYSFSRLQCSQGDMFTINGSGGNQTRLWGFININGGILSVAAPFSTGNNLIITAPKDSAWLIIHTNNEEEVSYIGRSFIDTLNEEIDTLNEEIDTLNEEIDTLNEEIDTLNEEIDTLNEEIDISIPFEHGTINLTDGQNSVSNNRIRTSDFIEINNNITIKITNNIKYSFRFYTLENDFISASSADIAYLWYNENKKIIDISKHFPSAKKVKLVVAYSDDSSTATSSEMNNLIDNIHIIDIASKIDTLNEEVDTLTTIVQNLNWQIGSIGINNGKDGISQTRIRTFNYIDLDPTLTIKISDNIKYNIFTYDKDKNFIGAFLVWQTENGNIINLLKRKNQYSDLIKFIRITCAYSNDAQIDNIILLSQKINLIKNSNMQKLFNNIEAIKININTSGLGNCSIRCAKEQSYIDGTPPVIEWFLLEEPGSENFYYSKDLMNKIYLFTFPYDSYKYSFGILQNGDIIACLDADSIELENKSDNNRVNPYVFLASENWAICHEVDFGTSLKPCGWLSNCGFKVLADGSAIFCEYTRQTTYTANVWRLSGDPTNASNWTVTKSFVVTSTDNSTGFKHCHMVMQDFYTGICYMSTGDDNIGSMLFYSTDNGQTWTQLQSPDSDGQVNEYGWITGSEKYCRALTFTFTEDYIYWSSDTPTETYHYLFKVARDSNGIFDFSTVTEIVNLPNVVGASTYGTALIPELNAILLLERTDSLAQEMDVRMVLLDTGTLISIGKMYVTENEKSTGAALGFRTRFSEWYPINGLVRVGFGLRGNHYNNDINHNKGFGNTGTWITGDGINNINNLAIQVFKKENTYGIKLNTYYI